MPGIRVPVAYGAERSLGTVFEPFVASAGRARDAHGKFIAGLKSDTKAATDTLGAEAARMAALAQKAFAEMQAASAKEAAAEIADANRKAQAKVKADQKAFDEKLKLIERQAAAAKRAAEAEEREIMRTAAATEKAELRKFEAAQKREEKARQSRGREIARDAMQTLSGVARAGVGVGREIVGGLGVSFDLSSAVSRSVDVESAAGRTTTSAAIAQGRTAKPEEIKQTIQAIHEAGMLASQDFGKLAGGLEDFVSKSSDLNTGKKILGELGLIARATGTDVDKLVSAAGDVNKTLEDSPDKAERLLSIMRLVAKQGSLGNVEVKDLAQYMGLVTASSFMYEGSKDKNIGTLGALAQVAMRGGATTAAEGTRAAAAFARDITKDAAAKRFSKAGIELYADEAQTKLRDPEKIITDFYQTSEGSLADLAKLFQNEMSKKVILGFSQVAEDAKKRGEDPVEAIHKEFAKFSATISTEDVQKAAAVSKESKEAKAQAFQNQVDMIVASLADRVLPALEKLAPRALEAADAIARLVGWASENPGQAITAAIVGSIAKAAIGNAVSGILEKVLQAAAGSAAGGVGLTIAVAAATFMIGKTLIDEAAEGQGKGVESSIEAEARRSNLIQKAQAELRDKKEISAATREEIAQEQKDVKARLQGAADPSSYIGAVFSTKTFEDVSREKSDAGMIEVLQSQAQKLDELIGATKGNKTVNVGNMPATPTPTPNAAPGTNTAAPQ